MLINTNIAFAIRCDVCNRLEIQNISIFDLAKGKRIKLSCTCCHTNAIVKSENNKTFRIEVPCFACQDTHVFTYNVKQFFKGNIVARCIETGMEIGFIGKYKDIQRIIAEYETNSFDAINELGFFDYFDNCDIVMKAINKIRELELEDKVYCDCDMGNVKIDLFPDRIELTCINCNSVQMIYAQNEDDLKNLLGKERIVLHNNSLRCIDAINLNNDNYNK
ncbi:MAG: hypothetical protein FH761_13835 [Firmicutes bacterium]|nr:hypothetical protein [Bacillota bacterium]